jgi:hypothetical protein
MPTINTDERMQSVSDGHPKGMIATGKETGEAKMRNSVRQLLGDTVRLSEQMTLGDLDMKMGVNHTTTGIPYAIHGTCKVVNANVTTWLAGFDDPIKSIMPVAIHEGHKIIVRRKYVVGGSAIITPEVS